VFVVLLCTSAVMAAVRLKDDEGTIVQVRPHLIRKSETIGRKRRKENDLRSIDDPERHNAYQGMGKVAVFCTYKPHFW
jgi:hypothetical protein